MRVAFVPGVSPDKWFKRWLQRYPEVPLEQLPVGDEAPEKLLHSGAADVCLLRLPVDKAALHAIPLYLEQAVLAVPREHVLSAFDAVDVAELEAAGENVLQRRPEPGFDTDEKLLELVGAGVGLYILPMSVARLYRRKDVVTVPLNGGPEYPVGLAWLKSATDSQAPREADSGMPLAEQIEEFAGIVRGRTAQSSRSAATASAGDSASKKSANKKSASEKAAEKKARRREVGSGKLGSGKPGSAKAKPGGGGRARRRRG